MVKCRQKLKIHPVDSDDDEIQEIPEIIYEKSCQCIPTELNNNQPQNCCNCLNQYYRNCGCYLQSPQQEDVPLGNCNNCHQSRQRNKICMKNKGISVSRNVQQKIDCQCLKCCAKRQASRDRRRRMIQQQQPEVVTGRNYCCCIALICEQLQCQATIIFILFLLFIYVTSD